MSSTMTRILNLREKLMHVVDSVQSIAPTLARFVLAYVFIETGWGKLHNLPDVIEYFRSINIPAPEIQAPFAAATELLCGLLLLGGLMTRLAAFQLTIVMTVAIVTARWEELESLSKLFSFIEFGYIVMFVYLMFYGAGALSLDRFLMTQLQGQKTK